MPWKAGLGAGKTCTYHIISSLLSNAVLPERNPLLELGERIEDDFQKMMYEWDSNLVGLQVISREAR